MEQMKMTASEDVAIGEDLFPPLSPLVFSLYDPLLHSHCSACALPLPSSPSFNTPTSTPLLFCSPRCSSHCFASSAAESILLRRRHSLTSPYSYDSSDLRAAIRLFFLCRSLNLSSSSHRVGGLLCNKNVFISSNVYDEKIQNGMEIRAGAEAVAAAVRAVDCLPRLEFSGKGGTVSEEEVLCVVLTNAVEVQSRGGAALGIAVYGTAFSWINHSCSPNTCYRFSLPSSYPEITRQRIVPPSDSGSLPTAFAKWLGDGEMGGLGPAVIVRSIRPILKGEEVTITYIDLLRHKAARRSELSSKYGFLCSCRRCASPPLSHVDSLLQEMTVFSFSGRDGHSEILFRDRTELKLSDYVEQTISDYLSSDDPDLCCARLENFLMHTSGLGPLELESRDGLAAALLHPSHQLCLDAYTTLASVYKLRRSDLGRPHFDCIRTASGFSLLLAGMVNHLLLFEPSIVVSAAGFWTDAGASLLELARGLGGGEVVDSYESHGFDQNERLGTGALMERVAEIARAVWYFLADGCPYLELVRNPFIVGGRGRDNVTLVWDFPDYSVGGGIFELGSLCSMYGRHLTELCFGKDLN